ncbi:MAG: CDP-diacylglycerol--serine O-phosphatidyltransferase [Methanotrichaceae archaeon]
MRSILHLIRIPDFMSLLNALLGFSAILMAFQSRILVSVALIFLATAADGTDGFLARRTETGPLGVNLDSLADAVSFGVAPAVLVGAVFGSLFWVLGGVYLVCGILRLARFNVTPKNEKKFDGMPIPAAGMMASVSVLFGSSVLVALLMASLSALMVSTIAYPKCRDPRFVPFALAVAIAALISWYKNDLGTSASIVFLALMIYLICPLGTILCRQREK